MTHSRPLLFASLFLTASALLLAAASYADAAPSTSLSPEQRQAKQACVNKLMKVKNTPKTYNYRWDISSICENKMPSDAWQDCMAGQMSRGGWLLKKPNDAYYSCDPRWGGTDFQQCVGEYLTRPGISESYPAFELCTFAPGGRACIEEMMKDGLRISDAKSACAYRSKPTRDCMRGFFKQEGVFTRKWPGKNELLLRGSYEADKYCTASNRETRACYLDVMVRFNWDIEDAVKFCNQGARIGGVSNPTTQEGKDCIKLLIHEMPDPKESLRELDASAVCTIPNFEMRACVFDKIITGFWKRYTPLYEIQCTSEFMKNLENPMAGLAHDIGCRFKQ